MTLNSYFSQGIDYYFVYDTDNKGGMIDGAIAGYRTITGAAPLYSKWVYGFWQCKEHYATQVSDEEKPQYDAVSALLRPILHGA